VVAVAAAVVTGTNLLSTATWVTTSALCALAVAAAAVAQAVVVVAAGVPLR
jgi:hypothetical protein